DYVQLCTETGLLGFGLLAWFFWQGGKRLYHRLWTVSSRAAPVFAALVTALGIMAFHELFDFNLQIPANAFLFTLLFALALRLTKSQVSSSKSQVSSWLRVPIVLGVGVIASILCLFALRQTSLSYPYDVKDPESPL